MGENGESKVNNKTRKTGREKYFEIKICMGYMKQPVILNMSKHEKSTILEILKSNYFVSQLVLEKILFELIIEDNGRKIRPKNFSGQLQREVKNKIPYWRIFLETESVTTGRRISREITKQIYDNMDMPNKDYGPLLTTRSMDNYTKNRTEFRLSLPNSDWHPGYFNKDTVKFYDLLTKDEVKQSLKDAPNKYKVLIDHLFKSDKGESK